METLFEKYQHLIVLYPGLECVVAGFGSERFILATEGRLIKEKDYTFRALTKDCFILPEYKDDRFRYCWINESQILATTQKGETTYENITKR